MKKKLIPFALLFTYLLPLVGCTGSKTCTITFDPNNGDPTFSITVNKGELLNEPESPEKTAYDFKAWRKDNVKWSFKYEKVQGDMTLVAYYAPVEYSLTIISDGCYVEDREVDYTIETERLPFKIDKPGYVLDAFIDQDGKKFTTLKGQYGDKTVTPIWKLDTNNFIELGSSINSLVRDEELISELDKLLPSQDYFGDIEYEGDKYCRLKLDNNRAFDNKYVYGNTPFYAKYEPLTWIKFYEYDDCVVYLSSYVLEHYNNSFPSSMNCYGGSELSNYVDSLADNFFTEEEKNRLYDFNLDKGTAKMFLPSKEEFEKAIPKLSSIPFISSFSNFSFTNGVVSSNYVCKSPFYSNGSWAHGNTIQVYLSDFHTRSFEKNGYMYYVNGPSKSFSYGNGSSGIRPCIAIKK